MTVPPPLLGAVIGTPVAHSLSPVIHEAAFAAAGRAGRFVARECGPVDLRRTLEILRSEGVIGVSVTMPLKEAVVELVDELSPDAECLNAVNCLSLRDGRIVGHNTDGDGCCDSLEQVGGATIAGATAVVLGAGGAARSVILGLARRGANVVVVNRTATKAHEVVAMLTGHLADAAGTIRVGNVDSILQATILVNATSVGMGSDDSPVPAGMLHAGMTVLDAVYNPLDTALLRTARQVGAETVDGLWMLIDQACRQQVVWFGESPDRNAMRAAAERELARRQK